MDSNADQQLLNQLSLARIQLWAGATIAARGQDYQVGGKVQGLGRTSDGALIAWVQGTRRYVTLLAADAQGLAAQCTCPYAGICKHVAAVAYAYLAQLANRQPLPLVAADDPRLAVLAAAQPPWNAADEVGVNGASTKPTNPLHPFLAGQSREQLLSLLAELATRFPAVRQALESQQRLVTSSPTQLTHEIRRLIASADNVGWDADAASLPPARPPDYRNPSRAGRSSSRRSTCWSRSPSTSGVRRMSYAGMTGATRELPAGAW